MDDSDNDVDMNDPDINPPSPFSDSTTASQKADDIDHYERTNRELENSEEVRALMEKTGRGEPLTQGEQNVVDYVLNNMVDVVYPDETFKETIEREIEDNKTRIEELREEIRMKEEQSESDRVFSTTSEESGNESDSRQEEHSNDNFPTNNQQNNNNSSNVGDYADPNLEMPSYMEPED
jgi:hypothetical protein